LPFTEHTAQNRLLYAQVGNLSGDPGTQRIGYHAEIEKRPILLTRSKFSQVIEGRGTLSFPVPFVPSTQPTKGWFVTSPGYPIVPILAQAGGGDNTVFDLDLLKAQELQCGHQTWLTGCVETHSPEGKPLSSADRR
jgi:hypothetical protein